MYVCRHWPLSSYKNNRLGDFQVIRPSHQLGAGFFASHLRMERFPRSGCRNPQGQAGQSRASDFALSKESSDHTEPSRIPDHRSVPRVFHLLRNQALPENRKENIPRHLLAQLRVGHRKLSDRFGADAHNSGLQDKGQDNRTVQGRK